MNILILGGGGREHALAWAILQNPKCDRLIVAPGNAGIAEIASQWISPNHPKPMTAILVLTIVPPSVFAVILCECSSAPPVASDGALRQRSDAGRPLAAGRA